MSAAAAAAVGAAAAAANAAACSCFHFEVGLLDVALEVGDKGAHVGEEEIVVDIVRVVFEEGADDVEDARAHNYAVILEKKGGK